MKKIPNMFKRNFDGDRKIFDEFQEECLWVRDGQGVATRKWDGTACMMRDGVMYKRFDAKKGKPTPKGWEPCQDAPDPNTGHWPGWARVGDGPEDRWHREAYLPFRQDGTYELIGPKIQGNPENAMRNRLIRHGCDLEDAPRTFDGLREYLDGHGIEGIVFWHPDGRKAKIRAKDFGVSR